MSYPWWLPIIWMALGACVGFWLAIIALSRLLGRTIGKVLRETGIVK